MPTPPIINATHLEHFDQGQVKITGHTPTDLANTRPGKELEGLHRRLTGDDGLLGKFHLDRDFHSAADQNNPEGHETGFGTKAGGSNEFSGTDDDGREDKTWSQLL